MRLDLLFTIYIYKIHISKEREKFNNVKTVDFKMTNLRRINSCECKFQIKKKIKLPKYNGKTCSSSYIGAFSSLYVFIEIIESIFLNTL